jgi:hypothetical protein
MHLGKDFFNWSKFIIALINIFIDIFGQDDDSDSKKVDKK